MKSEKVMKGKKKEIAIKKVSPSHQRKGVEITATSQKKEKVEERTANRIGTQWVSIGVQLGKKGGPNGDEDADEGEKRRRVGQRYVLKTDGRMPEHSSLNVIMKTVIDK